MIKNTLNGLKSFVLKPKLYKIIMFTFSIFIVFFLVKLNKVEFNFVRSIIIIIIMPSTFFMIGVVSKIDDEETKSFKTNQLQQHKQQNFMQNDNDNSMEIVDKIEKRTITTNRTETIETIYFQNGQPYRQKQTYYFKGDD